MAETATDEDLTGAIGADEPRARRAIGRYDRGVIRGRVRGFIEAKYERWQKSRHYGGTVHRPTVRKDQRETRTHRLHQGMKSLCTLMGGR